MLQKLMPKSDDFFSDFEAQAGTVVEGAKLLKALLDDFTDVARKCQAIKDVEHRGDDITHKAFSRLHTQFITPFDRSEIHRLLSRIDDVLDLADAAAERLGLYDVDTILPEAARAGGGSRSRSKGVMNWGGGANALWVMSSPRCSTSLIA